MSENRIEISPFEHSEHFFKATGLLVSIDKNGVPNMMALDWKTIGDLWYHPIITIAVAYNRYTYELLTKGIEEFTINIPSNIIRNAISIAGSFSGRDTDKFEKAGLEIIPGVVSKVPTLKNCLLNYECRIIETSKSNLSSHHYFYGKVLKKYASKDLI